MSANESELEVAMREASEMAMKRRSLEARRTELQDKIDVLKSGIPSSKLPSGGIYIATSQVIGVLDVARVERVTLQPGMSVASASVNAQRFGDRRVVFVAPETLAQLLEDGAIAPVH